MHIFFTFLIQKFLTKAQYEIREYETFVLREKLTTQEILRQTTRPYFFAKKSYHFCSDGGFAAGNTWHIGEPALLDLSRED